MSKSVIDQIEDQAVELFIEMKVPRLARLGTDAYAEMQRAHTVRNRIASDDEADLIEKAANGAVTKEVQCITGSVEIVEDPSLPPDAVVVEAEAKRFWWSDRWTM